MFRKSALLTSVCFLAIIFSGCSVKTYKMTKERVDQDLSAGNRGFLSGKPQALAEGQRKATREIQVVEVEFPRSKSRLQLEPAVESGITVQQSGAATVVSIPVDTAAEDKAAAVAKEAPEEPKPEEPKSEENAPSS